MSSITKTLNNLSDPLEGIKWGLHPKKFGEMEIPELDYFRATFFAEKRATYALHPSDFSRHSKVCRKKLLYDISGQKWDEDYLPFTAEPKMQRLVDLGTLIHFYIQMNLHVAGILKKFEPAVVSEEFKIRGHADGIVEIDGEEQTLEIKSINSFGFNKLREPKPEHIRQASIYAWILGTKKIYFVYYSKDTSLLKQYSVPADTKFIEAFKEEAKTVIKRFNSNRLFKKDKSFERVCANRTVERAMECPYATHCFKN